MAKQIINVGTAANSKNGDPLRTAFTKINANFTELYAGSASESQLTNGAYTLALGSTGELTFPNNYTFTGQTLTDTSGTTNYSLKIANGTTGSIFAVGTGTDAYGVANDALDHTQTTYVPYNATASSMSFNVPGYAGSLTINGAGVVTVTNGLVIGGTGNLTFPDATVQTTAYTGTSTTRSAGTIAGAGTVTLNYSTDRLVRATATGSTITIAHSNIAVGKVVDLVISNTSGGTCTVTYGVGTGNTVNGSATTAVGAGTTRVFTCRSFGTSTTDVYVTIV
jgi:hypothetical protein